MASLTRTAVGLSAITLVAACHPPQQTRGESEALAIYRRSVRPDQTLQFHGRSSAPVPGAEAGAGDTALTLDTAIALAKRNSARLAAIDARIRAADAAIEAAGQRNNPELRATNVRGGRAIDLGQFPRVVPRLRFSPERPGEIPAREAEARAASNDARAEARIEESAIEAEVRWLFDDAVLLDAEIVAAERAAATRRRLATQTRDRLTTGTATSIDVSLADLHAIEADARVVERRSRRALVVADLLDRIGRPPGTKLQLLGDPTVWPPPPLPSEQTLIETALKRSPRVSGAAARIDGASARLDLEQTRRWPWFRFVEVGYELEPSLTNVPLWTVGAGIELPIFSTNGGAIREAEASRAAAKQRFEAEVESIVRDVRGRLREANAAATMVSEFRSAALPILEHASTETARALENNTIDMLRALTIDERRFQVELQLLTLVRRYRTAVDALRRAVGGPLLSSAKTAAD